MAATLTAPVSTAALIAQAEEAEARAGIGPVTDSGPQPSAQTPTSPKVKVSKADRIFHDLYGHYQSECLAGCYRQKGRADAKVDVHRQSLLRPAPNTGKPFAETYEAKQARRAAARGGPVTVVRPTAQPAAKSAPPAAKPPSASAHMNARLDALDSRLTVLEVKLERIFTILQHAQVKANGG